MDYDALRGGLAQAIPYNTHLELEFLELADGSGSVRLPDEAKPRNHVGSQHAGGLFSAGEVASGAARPEAAGSAGCAGYGVVGAFAERMSEITPLARSAEIEYLKLAKGAITATATLGGDKDKLIEQLDHEGRVEFPVEVELTDEDGQAVAHMSVAWHVRKDS
jgi:acyl-coenzyme A thioesterase PaaI-like protein